MTFAQLHRRFRQPVSLLKNCVTMNSKDVVDSANAKALAEVDKFCLRVLTLLHAFMNGPDDTCFHQLVCGALAGSHCKSACDISAGLLLQQRLVGDRR